MNLLPRHRAAPLSLRITALHPLCLSCRQRWRSGILVEHGTSNANGRHGMVRSRRSYHIAVAAGSGTGTTMETERGIGGHDIYDVVCVGGGPAGLSLVTALRSNPKTSHLRLALIEAQPLPPPSSSPPSAPPSQDPPTTFSNRCSSLTPTSARFLDSIGAWRHIDQSRVQPYQGMRVWDGVSGASISFDAAADAVTANWNTNYSGDGTDGAGGSPGIGGEGVSGYMIENTNLTAGLLARIHEVGGVEVVSGAEVEGICYADEGQEHVEGEEKKWNLSDWPQINLSSGRSLVARLLVGADGANSPVRSFAGIESRGWDYGRHGVVATLHLDHDARSSANDDSQRRTAFQRFLPSASGGGPLALLPLPNNMATMVWSTTPSNAATLKKLPKSDFLGMVNAGFRCDMVDLEYMFGMGGEGGQEGEFLWRMEQLQQSHQNENQQRLPAMIKDVQEGSIASFPLKMRHADTYISPRVALVGDAAHTVHPLAGQGLNSGQMDVRSLAKAVEFATEHGMDSGGMLALEGYGGDRYWRNHVLLGVCDQLHKVYGWGSGPVVGVRSLGLGVVERAGWLKGLIMKGAGG